MAREKSERRDETPRTDAETVDTALEGAAQEGSGVIRCADVEGGDEIAIDAPPSAAGGIRNSPAPSCEDVQR